MGSAMFFLTESISELSLIAQKTAFLSFFIAPPFFPFRVFLKKYSEPE